MRLAVSSSAADAIGGAAGSVNWDGLLLASGGGWHQGRWVLALQLDQLTLASHDHLPHLPKTILQLTEDLLGIAIRPLLNGAGFLPAAGDQRLTLLLGLLTELEGIPLDPFCFCLAALLEACLLYTSPSPRDLSTSRMPSSA